MMALARISTVWNSFRWRDRAETFCFHLGLIPLARGDLSVHPSHAPPCEESIETVLRMPPSDGGLFLHSTIFFHPTLPEPWRQ